MKVDILNLQQLFGRPGRYEIPPFQRAYVWNRKEQWGPLWEDVQKKAEQYLETSPDQYTSHFLGSVVLQQQLVPAGQLMTRVVVDGQQRLTTLQLLLDAVQEVFEERGYVHAAKRLEILVLNQEAFLDDNQDHAFKGLAHDDRPGRLSTRNAQRSVQLGAREIAHRPCAQILQE